MMNINNEEVNLDKKDYSGYSGPQVGHREKTLARDATSLFLSAIFQVIRHLPWQARESFVKHFLSSFAAFRSSDISQEKEAR